MPARSQYVTTATSTATVSVNTSLASQGTSITLAPTQSSSSVTNTHTTQHSWKGRPIIIAICTVVGFLAMTAGLLAYRQCRKQRQTTMQPSTSPPGYDEWDAEISRVVDI